MKGIKKILMVLMVLSLIVVFAAPASAKWYDVTVNWTRVLDNGTVEINVERSGRVRTFVIPTGAENRMLATVLTAQTSGMALKIEVVDYNADGSDVTGMLLSSTPAP